MNDIYELTVRSAPEYLERKLSLNRNHIRCEELAGGVSSTVVLVETPGDRFVLKQSLGQLRVAQEWHCDRRRILQESASLRLLAPLLPLGSVPVVRFEDADNLLYGMSAAPAGAETWKTQLLRGETDTAIATAAGVTLAGIFQAGWQSPHIAAEFGNLAVFEQLRLDPYFGQCATRHPDLAPFFQNLIDRYPQRCSTLVHGDWSPKNMLVAGQQFMAIDFEVIHFGDPAFDVAFLLNHLLLKAFHRPREAAQMCRLAVHFSKAVTENFPDANGWGAEIMSYWAGLLLARMDGKSPVEYIVEPELQNHIRAYAKQLIRWRPATIEEVFQPLCP